MYWQIVSNMCIIYYRGKVAFVTGGGTGICFTITEVLMRWGRGYTQNTASVNISIIYKLSDMSDGYIGYLIIFSAPRQDYTFDNFILLYHLPTKFLSYSAGFKMAVRLSVKKWFLPWLLYYLLLEIQWWYFTHWGINHDPRRTTRFWDTVKGQVQILTLRRRLKAQVNFCLNCAFFPHYNSNT